MADTRRFWLHYSITTYFGVFRRARDATHFAAVFDFYRRVITGISFFIPLAPFPPKARVRWGFSCELLERPLQLDECVCEGSFFQAL